MTEVRFLHTADWQLGMRRHFLGGDALPRYMQARIEAIRAIARVAGDTKCSFVVAAGDVWESNQLDRRVIGRALEAMAEVPCPVFLLPGNHDPLDAGSVYRSREFEDHAPANVTVLRGLEPERPVEGVEVVGVPWPSKSPRRDLVAEACSRLEPAGDALRVCVAHGAVDTFAAGRQDPGLLSVDAMRAAAQDERVHYFALGDRHSAFEVAPRIWYSGTPERTDFGEKGLGSVLVVDLGEDGCTVTAHETGVWRFVALERELAGLDDVEAFESELALVPHKDVTILKLALTGMLSVSDKAVLDDALESMRALFASLDLWDRRMGLVVGEGSTDLGLSGFARAAAHELQELASSGDEQAPVAADALSLMYRLAAGGRS